MNKPVFIFDADGVINSLTNATPDARVVSEIANLLNNGHYVAINTGRGYEWVEENLVKAVKEQVQTSEIDHLFVATEMGGYTVEFKDGKEIDELTVFGLTQESIQKARSIFETYPPSPNLAMIGAKLSMATVHCPPQGDLVAFIGEAEKLANVLREAFAGEHVLVTTNTQAIDITTPEAGKWAGSQLIHDWLRRTPVQDTSHYICFGDNTSDYEMARFFGQQNHTVDFIFTGESFGKIEHDPQVSFTQTTQPFNNGSFEYLSAYKIPEA